MKKYILLANLSYLPDFGGVENSLRHLCTEYRKLGYTPIVLTCQSAQLEYKPCAKIGDAIVIRSRRQKGIWGGIITVLGLAVFAIALGRKRSFGVVVSRNQISSFFTRAFVQSHHVYLAPGFAKFQTANSNMQTMKLSRAQIVLKSIKRGVNNWLDQKALLNSDSVFVFSKNMVEQAKMILGKNKHIADNFQITKPGVQTARFRAPFDEYEKLGLREKYDLPKEEFLFLCIGRLVAAKGFDLAIKAIKLIPSSFSLIIVGDGPEREALEKLISDQGLSNRVFLKGSSNVPEEFYRLSDAFLMTSRYEPLGQTILEAASSGLEIISFSNHSVTEDHLIVTNATYEVIGEYGNYVTSANVKMLAFAMYSLAKRNKSSNNNELQALVHNRYTWRALAIRLSEEI